jgi:hypothetical protein
VTRPPDRFDTSIRAERWNAIVDAIEINEGRILGDGELARLGQFFNAFLPEHREDYPHRPMSRQEIWDERYYAFAELEEYVNNAYQGDYDLADYMDDEKDWRDNYEEVS